MVVVSVVVVTVSRGLMTKCGVPFLFPRARGETAWHGGIDWRLGLRLGALSWPPRRGPEGAWDSVGWSQNPFVTGGFASETLTFAKRQHDCAV